MVPPKLNETLPAIMVVELSGEIDLATHEDVAADIQACLDHEPPSLVVDMSRVLFIDSLGLSILVQAYEKARRAAVNLRIVANTSQVTKPLRLTGLDQYLPVSSSLVDALSRITAPL
ncbi:STAS domain-containing protein [Kibdelosporangium lantanae]|uniref:Anti-sigma factor antagonist n=1 Tax=Kibdelosporangium lantanae TaxID=1497396 RepID=A0ABW3MI19_9PSEU